MTDLVRVGLKSAPTRKSAKKVSGIYLSVILSLLPKDLNSTSTEGAFEEYGAFKGDIKGQTYNYGNS